MSKGRRKPVLIDVAAEAAHLFKQQEAVILAHLEHIDVSVSTIEQLVSKSNDLDLTYHIKTIRSAVEDIQDKLDVVRHRQQYVVPESEVS